MNTLFKGITAILPDEESGFSAKVCDIAVSDSVISYIGDDAVKNGFVPDRTIDGRDKLITAGLVNSHTHSYMSLFRNSADDLMFHTWLFDRIMPMEDKLTAAGAEYTGLPITLDGNIITGEALGAAIPFALALASRLAGQQASNAVKQGIVYRY